MLRADKNILRRAQRRVLVKPRQEGGKGWSGAGAERDSSVGGYYQCMGKIKLRLRVGVR